MHRQRRTSAQRWLVGSLICLSFVLLLLRDASPTMHLVVAVLAVLAAGAVWNGQELQRWLMLPPTRLAPVKQSTSDSESEEDLETAPATKSTGGIRWTLPTSCPGTPWSSRPRPISVPVSVPRTATPPAPTPGSKANGGVVVVDPVTLAPIHRGGPAALHQD